MNPRPITIQIKGIIIDKWNSSANLKQDFSMDKHRNQYLFIF